MIPGLWVRITSTHFFFYQVFSFSSKEEKPFSHSFIYLCRHTHRNTHQYEKGFTSSVDNTLKHLPTNTKHRSGWDSKPQSSRHLSPLSSWLIHVKYIASKPCFKYNILNSLSWRVCDQWSKVCEFESPQCRFFWLFLIFSLKKKSHSVILSFIHSFIQADIHSSWYTHTHTDQYTCRISSAEPNTYI